MNDAKLTVLAMHLYASDHQDMLPSELNQTSNYWNNAETPFTGTNNFELVTQGSLRSISNLMATIVIREKDPWLAHGKWNKTYGFADGHTEVRPMPAEGFESWEKQHMAIPAGNP